MARPGAHCASSRPPTGLIAPLPNGTHRHGRRRSSRGGGPNGRSHPAVGGAPGGSAWERATAASSSPASRPRHGRPRASLHAATTRRAPAVAPSCATTPFAARRGCAAPRRRRPPPPDGAASTAHEPHGGWRRTPMAWWTGSASLPWCHAQLIRWDSAGWTTAAAAAASVPATVQSTRGPTAAAAAAAAPPSPGRPTPQRPHGKALDRRWRGRPVTDEAAPCPVVHPHTLRGGGCNAASSVASPYGPSQ